MTSSKRRTLLAATLLLPLVARARNEAAPALATALARARGELAKL